MCADVPWHESRRRAHQKRNRLTKCEVRANSRLVSAAHIFCARPLPLLPALVYMPPPPRCLVLFQSLLRVSTVPRVGATRSRLLTPGYVRSCGNLRAPVGEPGVNPPGLESQQLRQAGGAAAQESNARDADGVRLSQGADTSLAGGGHPVQVRGFSIFALLSWCCASGSCCRSGVDKLVVFLAP